MCAHRCKPKDTAWWWVVFLSSCYSCTHFQTELNLSQAANERRISLACKSCSVSPGLAVILCKAGTPLETGSALEKKLLLRKTLDARDLWTVTCKDPLTPGGGWFLGMDLQGWCSKMLPSDFIWTSIVRTQIFEHLEGQCGILNNCFPLKVFDLWGVKSALNWNICLRQAW